MNVADRWYNQPDAIAILAQPDDHYSEELTARNIANYARTQRLLDADVAAMLDELQDAIVGPVIDRQRLEEWEESRARDFDVTDEVPY